MKKTRITRNSIAVRTSIILLLVVFMQSAIFSLVSMNSGIFEETEKNSLDIFEEKVNNRSSYLENEMLTRFTNLSIYASEIVNMIDQYLVKNDITLDTLSMDPKYAAELSIEASDTLIQILRANQVSGAYFILGNQEADAFKSNGLYLRDTDPKRNPNDISDLQCLRGISIVSDALNVPLSTKWQPQYYFERGKINDDFYYKMQETMINHPTLKDEMVGYWNKSTKVDGDNTEIITYTYPLRNEQREVYGYLGIDCSSDYLDSLLPSNEIGERAAYAVFTQKMEGEQGELVSSSGSMIRRDFENQIQINQELLREENGIIQNVQGEDVYTSVLKLDLYRNDSPYVGEKWYLAGFVHGSEILYTRDKLQGINQFATLVSLVFGILIAIIAVRFYSKPIRKLAHEVKQMNPNRPVRFNSTKIDELDNLSFAIESLSQNVAESASSFSRILSLTSYPFCAFEYYKETEQYFCSAGFSELLSLEEVSDEIYVKQDLLDLLKCLHTYLDESLTDNQLEIFDIPKDKTNHRRWIRMHAIDEENRVYGVLENITDEMLKMKKIEYERDYDVLTNLLNRRAYNRKMYELFEDPTQLKFGALMMSDLDNLKYVNDTFGHDCGDEYIRLMANTLKTHLPASSIISRVSGDEFFAFLYGYDTIEDVTCALDKFFTALNECVWKLPEGTLSRLRATSGIAIFPTDSDDFKTLNKYADFAMYKMKHMQKGGHNYFKSHEYKDDSYLLQSKEDFNQLIDKSAVYYVYQPIVDINTGEIFAYEALIRSNIVSLTSPLEILGIAKSQARLYDVERLTLFKSMETFVNQDKHEDYKIFINSIANQCLNEEDVTLFEELYAPYLKQIVIEVTEEEKLDKDFVHFKQSILRRWGAEIALDDYGNGYNGESALIETKPQYVKINQSIVRHLNKDKKRAQLLTNLVSYAKNNHIRIIAEDIESFEELALLKKFGVDYVQGFYIGSPNRILVDLPSEIKEAIRGLKSK